MNMPPSPSLSSLPRHGDTMQLFLGTNHPMSKSGNGGGQGRGANKVETKVDLGEVGRAGISQARECYGSGRRFRKHLIGEVPASMGRG